MPWHAMACYGMPWHATACHGMKWHVMAFHGRRQHAKACHAHGMPWHAMACHRGPLRKCVCIDTYTYIYVYVDTYTGIPGRFPRGPVSWMGLDKSGALGHPLWKVLWQAWSTRALF